MIIQGDCVDVLSAWPQETVDCIVTDPPFRTISGGNKDPRAPVGVLEANDGKIFKHNDIGFEDYLPSLYRVLKAPGHMYLFVNFMNLERAMAAVRLSGFRLHSLLVWHKNTTNPNRWYMKNLEYVIFAYKGPARTIYTPGAQTCVSWDNPRNKLHPTQKPVGLIRTYVEASSKPGELVLDPFAGSGTTGIACRDRRFVGIEIDPEYVTIARKALGNDLSGYQAVHLYE